MNNKCKKFVFLLWNISNLSITSKSYYNMIKDDFRVGVSQILGWLFSSNNRSFEVYRLWGNYLLIALKPSTPFTDNILFKFEDFKGRSILSGDFVAWDASALFKLLSLAKFLDKRLGFDSEVLPFDSLVFFPFWKITLSAVFIWTW